MQLHDGQGGAPLGGPMPNASAATTVFVAGTVGKDDCGSNRNGEHRIIVDALYYACREQQHEHSAIMKGVCQSRLLWLGSLGSVKPQLDPTMVLDICAEAEVLAHERRKSCNIAQNL